jgi:AcrR family transcriptional regulator
MERLAERAGVSKALPYRHFRDADDVLVALYRRETTALGRAVWERVSATPAAGDRVGVGVAAYFDALAPRRNVLVALSSPASAVPAMADPDGAGTRFAVRLLRELHGVEPGRAKAVAGMVQGAIVGAAASYLAGVVPRATVEVALVRMIHAALES